VCYPIRRGLASVTPNEIPRNSEKLKRGSHQSQFGPTPSWPWTP